MILCSIYSLYFLQYIYKMDFKIPIKPYLKRYLHYWYPMPYKLRMDDILGSFLYRLLRDQLNDCKYNNMQSKFTSKYTVRLSKKQVFQENSRNLNSETIYRFNVFIESLFIKELFSHLAQCEINLEATKNIYSFKKSPFTIKKGIFQFLEKYKMNEDELNYETLQKRYYRFKQKNINKSIGRLSINKNAVKVNFYGVKLTA